MLSASRAAEAAEQFFRTLMNADLTTLLHVITVDKNAAYPPAFDSLQHDQVLPEIYQLRQCKFLNNPVEQDHRFVKRRVHPGLGVGAFATASRTIQGYEAIHLIRKSQIEGTAKRDVLAQNKVIGRLFGLAA
jgi:transposase-like protein